MAGISTPVLGALSTLKSVRSGISSLDSLTGFSENRTRRREEQREREWMAYEQAADLTDLRARQDEAQSTRQAELRLQAERIQADADSANRSRTRALRHAVGRTRAQLGSQGISSVDGSGEAVLLGLVREAEEDAADAKRLDDLRLKALEEDNQSLYRRNLLDLTRLQERQRLERLARGWS